MGISLSTTLQASFDDAAQRTREALATQGFGVLTEIDVKATLKKKLGEDIEDYLILGACNPQFAHQAVNVYRQVGLLMPCNVVVCGDPGSSDTSSWTRWIRGCWLIWQGSRDCVISQTQSPHCFRKLSTASAVTKQPLMAHPTAQLNGRGFDGSAASGPRAYLHACHAGPHRRRDLG